MGTLNEVHMQMQTAASAIGLEININKRTKKGNEVVKSDITLNGQTFEDVDNFKYLGALMISQNEVETDIKEKIAAGNRCYRSFGKIFGTRYLSKNKKIRIYKTIIRPVVLYGSETWAITGKNCIQPDDMVKKDFTENIWTKM
jgi:hypothetical protein